MPDLFLFIFLYLPFLASLRKRILKGLLALFIDMFYYLFKCLATIFKSKFFSKLSCKNEFPIYSKAFSYFMRFLFWRELGEVNAHGDDFNFWAVYIKNSFFCCIA